MVNIVAVDSTAMVSATGSARNTANTLSWKKTGRMKISGMSRMIFLSTARNRDIYAFPRAIKVCWQAIWIPKIKDIAM